MYEHKNPRLHKFSELSWFEMLEQQMCEQDENTAISEQEM